ncbi:LOW QUALITY PROTEIN: pre-mRNA-splicing factor cwf25 [Prunus dulcis]|uniref:LOW QUALITY PROTEIN: pre-mRNA-splicing factor cwf25 n=1 Tax=Prunus dulcis TaxID=3755 RepID=UPI00148300A8|nr:LOW QUALITY PROTEIN: pre-mRNA-splicing factor cwf25 [Prunus dulcis]
MALKFLNKKGWHTGSLLNIENVWKAEQKHEAEQKKLDELRKQIVEERKSGALLVPIVSKPLKPYSSAASKQQASASVSGAMFEEKPQSANDAWRKLHLDPLLMIRQREQEIYKSSLFLFNLNSENDTAEVERRKSGHRKISKYVKHSDSEDESRKSARRRENNFKHSDSEDESRISAHRSGKNPVKRSDSEDEFRYRTRRSEKNHVKHSDSEDESRIRAHRSGKNPVKHSDSEDEFRYRTRRSEKNHVKHSDSKDE